MNERLARFARLLQRVLAVTAALLVLVVVAGSFFLYHAVSGPDLPALRRLTATLGRLMAGQRTEHMALNVRLQPEASRLVGTATLTLRSLEDGRQHFYFLLNPGLRVQSVRLASNQPDARPSVYQLSLLTIIDPGAPVAKDATVQLVIEYDGHPGAGLFNAGTNSVTAGNVLLGVESFWYPSDVQSFFTADVSVTAPAAMTVVHNGVTATRIVRGTAQEVRWVSDRPVAGMALVAGSYTEKTATVDDIAYRLYLEKSIDLDAARVLDLIRAAQETLAAHYGASGFNQVTVFVTRELRRAFNDGSGLMGVSIRYFRSGDYGFGILAHELAHNWWGATVAEQWLSPGTGGEWIVEGFSEFSSLVATESRYGPEALARRLSGAFFDPARQASIASMSVLDNALAEATARDTIYRKGGYVAMMLRRILGDDIYFQALRQFLERFRYQQVSDVELQQVLEEVSQQKLEQFFADWVRSDRLADLALDGASPTEATVNNLGPAAVPGPIEVWKFKKVGGAPERGTVQIGEPVRLSAEDDYAILDPLLAWADMQRENNRYPRHRDPVFITAASGNRTATTIGEVFPWVRATVTSSGGDAPHAWDFERGLLQPPTWATDGSRVVVSYSDAAAPLASIINLTAAGARQRVGTGSSPAAGPEGSTYAVNGDRLVRFAADGAETTVIRHAGFALEVPLPSPDGTQVAYTAARGNALDLRVVRNNGTDDRLLLPWDRDRTVLCWSPDGSRLYALMGGNWDWQIWEIPVDFAPVRVLVRDAAAIGSLALSPNGSQLAFTAAPEIDYPTNRRQLYILDVATGQARNIDIADSDLSELTWLEEGTLLVVATATGPNHPWTLPAGRSVKRVRLADESVTDFE